LKSTDGFRVRSVERPGLSAGVTPAIGDFPSAGIQIRMRKKVAQPITKPLGRKAVEPRE
jgi:hypothetical protein